MIVISQGDAARVLRTITNFPGWVLLLPPIFGVGDSLSQEPTTLAPLVSRTRMLRSFPEMPFISVLLTEISPPTHYSRPRYRPLPPHKR